MGVATKVGGYKLGNAVEPSGIESKINLESTDNI